MLSQPTSCISLCFCRYVFAYCVKFNLVVIESNFRFLVLNLLHVNLSFLLSLIFHSMGFRHYLRAGLAKIFSIDMLRLDYKTLTPKGI